MSSIPVLLVSCTRCQLLHAPLREDAANPLCSRCVVQSRAAEARYRVRDGRDRERTR